MSGTSLAAAGSSSFSRRDLSAGEIARLQLTNCADWNMREAEQAERNSRDNRLTVDERAYFGRRAERLDMQAFRLFRQAHELARA